MKKKMLRGEIVDEKEEEEKQEEESGAADTSIQIDTSKQEKEAEQEMA